MEKSGVTMRQALLLSWAWAALLVQPALAGSIYIPVAANGFVDDNVYKTELWATNLGGVPRRFETTFLPLDSDGVIRSGDLPETTVVVEPGATVFVGSVAPFGNLGMLEIRGAPQLILTARLQVTSVTEGLVATVQLPIVSASNQIPADTPAHLQSLERITSSGTVSHFGIINLGHEQGQCEIKAFRSDSSQIAHTALVTVQPLSQRLFPDALGILGADEATAVRFEVVCDQNFYPYATVTTAMPPSVRFVAPSTSLSDQIPGPGEGPPVAGEVVFELPGTFFEVTQGDPVRRFQLPLQEGVAYRQMTVEFDMFLRRWQSDLFHHVVGVNRPGTLYFGLFLRGDNSKTIFDMGDEQVIRGNGPWRENTQYHLSIVYDTQAGILTFNLFHRGELIHTVSGPIVHSDLSNNGNPVQMTFGLDKIVASAFFPPFGWRFSNLKVEAIPF